MINMELFRILGKIAIDNAEAKKKIGETGQEGGKLAKVFSTMGRGAAVAGKAIATGLAVGAGACVGLATAAIKSYGDYEQLVGGVETLFGTRGAKTLQEYADMVGKSVKDVEAEFGMLQEAQSRVMENASNAYKTAGLSVNEYMESVNGIAAALNQSSASQLESADLANQAVIDMSDNAAKMGTSMEAIQNAYAGFSKQNYTMLDNLKLGYGGTKEEMQRLLKDAEKISGIKYDISSFADVTQAIHVMQEEMGIAGTTAKEAAGTIQGSFGMLKGAWSNLLVGFSDPSADLQSLINNVFESATTFAGNLVPRITQVFQGIATAFKTLVPMLAGEIPNLFNQVLPALVDGAVALVDGLVAALPGIMSAIQAVLPGLIQGVNQILSGLIDALIAALPMLIDGCMLLVDGLIGALPQIITAIVAALPTLIPQLIDAVVNIIMMLVTMFPQIIQPIIDALPTIIVAIVDALVSNLPVLIQGCVQLIGALAAALPQVVGALWTAIGQIFVLLGQKILGFFEPVKTAVSNAWQAMGNVPGLSSLKTMIEQVWAAIMSHIRTVLSAISSVVSTAWNAIKNVISTVLNAVKNVISTAWNAIKTIVSNVMKLISSVLKGDWEGVKSAISNILNAIKSVITSVWNGIKSVISSVLNGIKSVVSSVWNGIKSVISSALNSTKSIISSVWNGIKSTISSVINGVKSTVKSGFNDVKNNAVSILKSIPGKVASVGMDIVRGIGNGITSGIGWIKSKITAFVGDVTSFIKKLFKIASPSKLMRDEVGRYIAEGVAVGIQENTSAATAAMKQLGDDVVAQAKANIAKEKKANDELNSEIVKVAKEKLEAYKLYNNMTIEAEANFWDDIRKKFTEGTEERIEADKAYFEARNKIDEELLSAAEKRLDEYKTYNKMTLADEVGFWDEIRLQCQEGTDSRLQADKKYLEAKKNLNDQIETAEKELQNSLDEIYKKVDDRAEAIEKTFDLFSMADVDKGINSVGMFYTLDSQVKALEKYQTEIEALKDRIGETELFEEIQSKGVGALKQVAELNKLSDYSLQYYLDMYDKRTELAKEIATSELQDETQAETEKAYQDFADKMAGLGVEIVEETEAMKTGAVNNLKTMLEEFTSALEAFSPKMKLPHFKIEGKFDIEAGTVPAVAVEWFKKAMNNAMILDKPTIFGYNAKSGNLLGAGDAGSEVVAGTTTLMNMIQTAVATQNGALISYLQKIVEMLATFFPEQIETFRNMKLQLNTGALVGELVYPMDQALGKLSNRKDRGR